MQENNLMVQKRRADKDPSIELLLEFDAPNNSQNFLDTSNYRKNIQVVGDPRINRDIFEPGTYYCFLAGRDQSQQALIVPDGVRGGLLDRDFCVEAWMLWSNGGGTDAICHIGYGTPSNYSGIILTASGMFAANAAGNTWGAFAQPSMTTPVTGGIFRHTALVRKNGVYRLFNQGVKQGVDMTLGYTPRSVNPEAVMVGNQATSGALAGYMEYFRLTVDNHRYWDDFTPIMEKTRK